MLMPLNQPVKDWQNQKVWLVGASSGIGAALAVHMACLGAEVAISARRTPELHEVALQHPHIYPVQLDVLDHDAWPMAYDRVCQAICEPDMLVFCVGDYTPLRAWEVDASGAERIFRVNVVSAYSALQTVLPAMLQRGAGRLVLVGSVAGYTGLPFASSYGPSKAALINLAEILYEDLHPRGLSVHLVSPGFVQSRLTDRNHFSMPARLTPDQAAEAIVRGLEKGEFETHFPKRFTYILKLLRILPYRGYFSILKHAIKP